MAGIQLGLIGSFAAAAAGAFEPIASQTLSSSASSVTFSSIPQTYKHLQIRVLGKMSYSAASDWSRTKITLNGTATTRGHTLEGSGSTVYAFSSTGDNTVAILPGNSADLANMFGAAIIDIHDYSSTTKNKTVRSFFGSNCNGITVPFFGLGSAFLDSTSAITSLSLADQSFNLVSGSVFSLYGIKGE